VQAVSFRLARWLGTRHFSHSSQVGLSSEALIGIT
jgi:hypothetical protein